MRNIPAHVLEAAKRIGKRHGVSVRSVIAAFAKAVSKRAFTASDFFCNESDISLKQGDR